MDLELPVIHLDCAAIAALYEAHDAELDAADEADEEAAKW